MIVVMFELAPSSTMEEQRRGLSKLPSFYEELSLSWLPMFVDFDLKLLMSSLVIVLYMLLLINFSMSSFTIHNFFLQFFIFFFSF